MKTLIILPPKVFCDAWLHQIRFSPGLRPGHRWGSSRRSPIPSRP